MAEKKMNWQKAEAMINRRIANLALRPSASSSIIIGFKLAPLRARFDRGERTPELYEEIMAEAGE